MASKKYNHRRHEIYFPSPKDLDRWKDQADKHHVSLSKWIYEMVEDGLASSLEPDKTGFLVEDVSKASGRIKPS